MQPSHRKPPHPWFKPSCCEVTVLKIWRLLWRRGSSFILHKQTQEQHQPSHLLAESTVEKVALQNMLILCVYSPTFTSGFIVLWSGMVAWHFVLSAAKIVLSQKTPSLGWRHNFVTENEDNFDPLWAAVQSWWNFKGKMCKIPTERPPVGSRLEPRSGASSCAVKYLKCPCRNIFPSNIIHKQLVIINFSAIHQYYLLPYLSIFMEASSLSHTKAFNFVL